MSLEIKDKLYTSTQVAEILGVSLRTLYRYMEDNKIQSMRTASGRHRFTKDQIMDFLNAGQTSQAYESARQSKPMQSQPVQGDFGTFKPTVNQFQSQPRQQSPFGNVRPVVEVKDDWDLEEDNKPTSDFQVPTDRPDRRFSTGIGQEQVEEPVQEIPQPVSVPQPQVAELPKNQFENVDLVPGLNIRYYNSEYADLIELAKKIKETAMSKDLEYGFTLHAGLSLHTLLDPFTLLHIYANPEDMQIWKDALRLSPAQKREDANLGVIVNTDIVFVPTKEIGGFKVVEDKVLLRDLSNSQEEALVKTFRSHLSSS